MFQTLKVVDLIGTYNNLMKAFINKLLKKSSETSISNKAEVEVFFPPPPPL